ncbi:MAG TPA: hypothetical protein DEP89_04235, partial [Methylophilaceae bacterium]|nr:hypothetical protein [Methylophilaceae bacterium]
NDAGQTVLMYAAKNGDIKTIETLLDHGADPNIVDKYKCSPLMYASREGNADAVALFIKRGLKIDYEDQFNWTALTWATKKNHITVAKILIGN